MPCINVTQPRRLSTNRLSGTNLSKSLKTGWHVNASIFNRQPNRAAEKSINAVHTSARDASDTDWWQIVALYDQLVRLDPSPIIAMNRAIAVAVLDGAEVGLVAVDRLADPLAGYHAYHATRADLLRRLGRAEEARAAYDRAIELAGNTAETAYLTRRRDELA